MSTIHMHQTTTLTPAQYIAGLTDFGPGRSHMQEMLDQQQRRLELMQDAARLRGMGQ
jgi:hypothetical protein